MKHLSLRHAIIETAQKMTALGLNQGTAGNVSVRADDTLLLTPSGVAYEDLTPGDIVSMTFDNRWSVENPGRYPTSEWRIHRDILSTHNEVGAVLHAHSPFCTTLACLQRDIPAFHYMIAVAGGHREESFAACRWLIDTLKKDVPIWKKDVFADGTVDWVSPEGVSPEPTERNG